MDKYKENGRISCLGLFSQLRRFVPQYLASASSGPFLALLAKRLLRLLIIHVFTAVTLATFFKNFSFGLPQWLRG